MKSGPLPTALRPFLAGVAGVYGSVVQRRNQAFDQGRRVVTLDRPVISVGNLTVGGVGKTPLVTSIVQALRDAGHDPAIAMRGYRAVGGLSDEADAYLRRFDDLPMVVQPNRVDGLIDLFALERGAKADCVVLDDGFQHRRLGRQLDIVAIDAAGVSVFDDHLLPVGWLREPVDSLRRAHAVVLTHADRADVAQIAAIERHCKAINEDLIIARAAHAWAGCDVSVPGPHRGELLTSFAGLDVIVVCAIGKPERFVSQAAGVGMRVVESVKLRDHDPYDERTVRRLERVAGRFPGVPILTTDKDWSKIRRTRLSERATIFRPRLEIAWLGGGDALVSKAIETVRSFERAG